MRALFSGHVAALTEPLLYGYTRRSPESKPLSYKSSYKSPPDQLHVARGRNAATRRRSWWAA